MMIATQCKNLVGIGGVVGTLLLLPVVAYSRTLDQAVSFLLADNCLELTNAGGIPDNNLISVCGGASGSSEQSSGGGAATPTTLPVGVTERLKKKRGEQEAEPESAEVQLGRGVSVYATGQYEALDRDETTFEDGYDSDIWQLSVGVDNRVSSQLIAGAAVSASRQEGDFDTGGDFELDSYAFTLYGLFQPGDDVFLQVAAGYAAQSHDRTRIASFRSLDGSGLVVNSVTGKASSDYDADQFSFQLLGGYNYSKDNFTYGPRIGLDWLQTDYDDYDESGSSGLELSSHDDDVTSLQSSLGLWGSIASNTRSGVMTTQASIAWKHEFDQDQRDVEVSFVDDLNSTRFDYKTENPDRDFFEFNLGLTFILPNDIHTFINYRTLIDHEFIDNHVATVGLRMGI